MVGICCAICLDGVSMMVFIGYDNHAAYVKFGFRLGYRMTIVEIRLRYMVYAVEL